MKRLVDNIEPNEQADLLSLLLGRVLHIVEENQQGELIEREVHQIVQTTFPVFTSASDNLIHNAALDILRYLPARSVAEITDVLSLAEEAEDEQVQQACAMALQYSNPETEEAWRTLESGRQSRIMEVRKAVEERISRRR